VYQVGINKAITSYVHSFLCLREVTIATFLRKFISAASNLSPMNTVNNQVFYVFL